MEKESIIKLFENDINRYMQKNKCSKQEAYIAMYEYLENNSDSIGINSKNHELKND